MSDTSDDTIVDLGLERDLLPTSASSDKVTPVPMDQAVDEIDEVLQAIRDSL